MKNLIYLLLITIVTACQTAKIKNEEYKISASTVELGCIGTASSFSKLKNDFITHTFPVLENKIRLDIQQVPFNKNINKIYTSKIKENQLPNTVSYIDSLPEKPKFVTITLMDYAGIINELNTSYNKNSYNYLKDTGKGSIITSIAIVLPEAELTKLKLADTYYLINEQTAKYNILLYKDGKKIDFINLQSSTVLAYTVGKFCWAINERHNWYIGDIVNDSGSCAGDTHKKIKEKEEKNLFKL